MIDEMVKLYEAQKYDEAYAISIQPYPTKEERYRATLFKGMIESEWDKHEEAIDSYQKAIDMYGFGFNTSIARYYLALSQFSIGKHKDGWRNLFHARLENDNFAPLSTSIRRFSKINKQLLTRQEPPGIVHVHAEAGYGDNFLFLRYLPLIAEKGFQVRYEARNAVFKLAQDSFPDIEVVREADDHPGIAGLKDFDYHLPMVDIPFVFQTDIDTIPWNGPYLKADPELVKKYEAAKGKIGLCWSANPMDRKNQRASYAFHKSMTLDLLKPIIDVDPSRFVAIQAGPATLDNYPEIIPNIFSTDQRTISFADTAAIIENCDLVISIDTAVAHLAGAMGKPCWVMMHRHLTSFQFMTERPGSPWNTKNPWYPSIRVFRQKVRDDWTSVVEAIKHELYETGI